MNVLSKKVLSGLIAAGFMIQGCNVMAAEGFVPDSQEWQQRQSDLQIKHEKDTIIGLFPGSVDIQNNMHSVSKFLHLMNFLTKETGSLYSYVQVRKAPIMQKEIMDREYKVLYVSPDLVVSAIKAGYKPIAQRIDGISVEYVVRKDSPYKTIADLNGKIVASVPKVLLDNMMVSHLADKKIAYTVMPASDSLRNQKLVLMAVKEKKADFGVARRGIIDNMPDGNKAFRVVGYTPLVPGFMFLVRDDFPKEETDKLQNAVLSLVTGKHSAVLDNLESGKIVRGGFIPYDESTMVGITRITEKLLAKNAEEKKLMQAEKEKKMQNVKLFVSKNNINKPKESVTKADNKPLDKTTTK